MKVVHALVRYHQIAAYAAGIARSRDQRRYLWSWLRSLRPNYLLEAPRPWLTFAATDYLRQNVRAGAHVFEYGCGGSTLFWLTFTPSLVVSIEHDPTWHAQLAHRLHGSSRVDLRLVRPEPIRDPGATADPADPAGYRSDDATFVGYDFRTYVSQIDSFPDSFFDVVLIDGRARPSCIAHSVAKVRRDGLIILDNAERGYYLAKSAAYLHGCDCLTFGGIGPVNFASWQTNIYRIRR